MKWHFQFGRAGSPYLACQTFALFALVLTHDQVSWVVHVTVFNYAVAFGRVEA